MTPPTVVASKFCCTHVLIADAVPAPPPGPPPNADKMERKVWWLIPTPTITPFTELGREPESVPAQLKLHDTFVDWHAVGAWLTLGLLLLHVLCALKHQLLDKEAELARMGIGKQKTTAA